MVQTHFAKTKLAKRSMQKQKFALSLFVSLALTALTAQGCKASSSKKKNSDVNQTPDALGAEVQGYLLQDLKPLSGSLVRLVRGAESKGETLGQGVLIDAKTALVAGYDCSAKNSAVVFQAQGDEPIGKEKNIGLKSATVTSCQTVAEKIAEIEASDTGTTDVVSSLKEALEKSDGFSIASVSFDGGLPSSKKPKWNFIGSHSSDFDINANSSEFSAWNEMAGKFVVVAGFNKPVETSFGAVSRRFWLPYKVQSSNESSHPFLFQLESGFSDVDRSPIKKAEKWLEGPDKSLFPAMAFTGASRYPAVRPFAEIQTLEPEVLCFVTSWKDNGESPLSLKFTPNCLSAAPVIALFK